LSTRAVQYERDTGIDGLYMGFPFLLVADANPARLPRIAPVLLWPITVRAEVGTRGSVTVCFDRDREEVRLNPACESILGTQAITHWQQTARELIQRDSSRAADVIDAFGTLASARGRELVPLPGKDTRVRTGGGELVCSAVLFHLVYSGQAIAEDLRILKGAPVVGTSLETIL